MSSWELRDNLSGSNACHVMMSEFRQSMFGGIVGYEDANEA